jgi:hypothetical protein
MDNRKPLAQHWDLAGELACEKFEKQTVIATATAIMAYSSGS